MKFLLLAAGRSSRIYKKINKPKCLININGESLITKIIKNINDIGNYQINIVVGFKSKEIKKELKNFQNIKYINNKFYKTRDMTHSFITALKKINDDLIVTYTDILFDKKILKIILKNKKKEILLPILKNWKDVWKRRKKNYFEDGEDLKIDSKNYLNNIGGNIDKKNVTKFQYTGIFFIPKKLKKELIETYNQFPYKKIHLTEFFNILVNKNKIKIKCLKVSANWYEFDDFNDLINFNKRK